MEKIKIYHDHGVKVFSGGDFAEAAIAQKKFDQYCQETKKLGYDAVEISDGLIDISAEEKFNYIRRAINEHGLAVMGEVGKKEYKHKLIHWTVAKFGANVNLGNIEWEEIMVVEMTRVGTQSTTSFKGGAYYLT